MFVPCIDEYFIEGHAEPVPAGNLERPCNEVFYLQMHAVAKPTNTTTQLCVVFDASAKSKSGASLSDQLLIGPTVHALFLDVLLHFRMHKVALTTDISRMYRAVHLPRDQCDLHRFV